VARRGSNTAHATDAAKAALALEESIAPFVWGSISPEVVSAVHDVKKQAAHTMRVVAAIITMQRRFRKRAMRRKLAEQQRYDNKMRKLQMRRTSKTMLEQSLLPSSYERPSGQLSSSQPGLGRVGEDA